MSTAECAIEMQNLRDSSDDKETAKYSKRAEIEVKLRERSRHYAIDGWILINVLSHERSHRFRFWHLKRDVQQGRWSVDRHGQALKQC